MPRLGIAPRLLQPQCRVLLLYYLGVHFARIVVTDWNAELQNGVRSHNYRTATLAKRLMRLPRKQKVVSSNLTGGSFLFFLARAHKNNGGKNGPSGCVKTIWVTSQWPNWIRRLTTNQEIGGSSPSWDIFLSVLMYGHSQFQNNKTNKNSTLDGIRTRNPQIRSLMRYPLRHERNIRAIARYPCPSTRPAVAAKKHA